MEIVALTKEDIQVLLAQTVERAISSFIATTNTKDKPKSRKIKFDGLEELIDIDKEIDNWITLHEAWDFMKIKKNKWYSKYNKVIRHKPYGTDIWVYKPSIYEFFVKDNINEKKSVPNKKHF